MQEIHDPNARRIVELAMESQNRPLPSSPPPEEAQRKPEGSFDDSMMAIQTVTGAFIMPFLILAGLFGASMSTRD